MKDCGMSLVISFVLKLKGDERIDGDGLWSYLSCIIGMEVCRQIGSVRHGEKWMSVGNDGMGKLISLYSIYSYVLIGKSLFGGNGRWVDRSVPAKQALSL